MSTGGVRRPLDVVLTVLAALGLALAAVEAVLIVDAKAEPLWIALLFPMSVCVWFVAGALAWRRRPENSMGALLIAGGAVLFLGGLVNAAAPALVTTGLVFQTFILAIVYHALLSFPSGRVRGRLARAIVGTAWVLSTVLQAPSYLFVPGPSSPYTHLRISRDGSVAQTALDIQHATAWVLFALTLVLLARRLREATPVQRRLLTPVYLWGLLCACGIPISAQLLDPSEALTVAQVGVIITGVPIAFALGTHLGAFPRTAALEELGRWLSTGDRGVVAAVTGALGDPSVELVRGAVPVVGPGRGAVAVEVYGETIGAIVYDATLIADPESVRAAGRVVGLALVHEGLRGEIADAADAARRSVAHDLHDGLQSRLVVLGMQASMRGDDELRAGLETAVADLRRLVSGVAPAVLAERGLYGAARELVAGIAVPVELRLDGDGSTLSNPVQTAGYFIVAEAMTNAVKHAGAHALGVHLERTGAGLRIEVSDDGVGGAEVPRIRERVLALGGRLSLESPPGAGTRLVAELPCV